MSWEPYECELMENSRENRVREQDVRSTIFLTYTRPYHWRAMLDFLRVRAVEGLEWCDELRYQRTWDANGCSGLVSVEAGQAKNTLIAKIRFVGASSIPPFAERLRALFDVDADMPRIEATLRRDRRFKVLQVEMAGVRVPGTWDPFELGVRAIIGQQVMVTAARTLLGRLCEQFGEPLVVSVTGKTRALPRAFPKPDALAEADIARIGIPRRRAECVRALAFAVANGDIVLSALTCRQDLEQRLLALPGIGRWTVGYIGMRALKNPDAFPVGDVALLKAAHALDIASTSAELEREAERWRPWRAYAAVRLWRSLSST